MIDVDHLSKRYGETLAVDDLSFTIRPGQVTGFLGPNGAGKSTTMRMIVGLDKPSAGSVTVDGRRYRDLPAPLREVGAMLEARAIHTGRSAYHHLLAMAQSNRIAKTRVDEVIELVGLERVARKRVGGFSLGMGQRLGIAAALLGDPPVLILDEPANGLDPEGILWIRNLLKGFAREGRTVFLSSHLMSEMAADRRSPDRRRTRPVDRRRFGGRDRPAGLQERGGVGAQRARRGAATGVGGSGRGDRVA